MKNPKQKYTIPEYYSQTGELNPHYKELTGEKNPLKKDIEVEIDDLHREDVLSNNSLFIYESTIKCYENKFNSRRQIMRIKKLIEKYAENNG